MTIDRKNFYSNERCFVNYPQFNYVNDIAAVNYLTRKSFKPTSGNFYKRL